jgi:hypothetical protein
MYLSHPFTWKFGSFYESIALLGIAKKKMIERDLPNADARKIRDCREEMRIAKKYGFAKLTAHGYEMLRGIPIIDFPDKEFEEKYSARNLNMARRISSWKKRRNKIKNIFICNQFYTLLQAIENSNCMNNNRYSKGIRILRM